MHYIIPREACIFATATAFHDPTYLIPMTNYQQVHLYCCYCLVYLYIPDSHSFPCYAWYNHTYLIPTTNHHKVILYHCYYLA